ncbi:MAG: IS1634 family transposase [Candidatus Edwardsbacteria bacterium]|nr:IS1634 family transposase [Candidatus Edwardsbacteria bacterium]
MDRFWRQCRREHRFGVEVVMAVKAMVFNRLSNPKSKLAVSQWLPSQYLPGVDAGRLSLHHFYRALEVLQHHKERLEDWCFDRLTNLLNLDLSLVFYDLTSTYFEGQGPEIACHGYSRDHRPDCHQIQIGLLVNGDGLPISHYVFDGARSEQKTLPQLVNELRSRFQLKRCIFVADDGIVTTATMDTLKQAGYQTICAARMGQEKKVPELISLAPDVQADPAAWHKVKDNLWIYELPRRVDGYRICVVFNPVRQQSQRRKRELRLLECQAYLESFTARTKRGGRKNGSKVEQQIDRWLRAKGARKYFEFSRSGPHQLAFSINRAALEKAERLDGMLILKTDAEQLSPVEVALGYRTLTQVEAAFDEIKNFIKLRPIRHWADLRVRGHVTVCVLAYLLESVLENILAESNNKMTARKALELTKSLKVIKMNLAGKELYKTTRFTPEQMELYRLLGMSEIIRVFVK